MKQITQVTRVEPLEPSWLRLWFSDGSIHDVDVGVALRRGGVFSPIHEDPAVFARVRVNGGTVEWPGEVDLDPLVLHGEHRSESGLSYPRRIVRGPRTAQRA